MAKMSTQNAIWILTQMSRSTFYGSHVVEAIQIGIKAIRETQPKTEVKEKDIDND